MSVPPRATWRSIERSNERFSTSASTTSSTSRSVGRSSAKYGHHREVDGRAQLGEERQSLASRLHRGGRDERAEHRDARGSRTHQRAQGRRDVVLEELRAIDVEVRHRQGPIAVAQLDAEEERVAAGHRDPAHPRPEGDDLGLGVGARIEPTDDELPATRARKRIEHGPGAPRMSPDARRDAFLSRAPEERHTDLARQRFDDGARPRRKGVLALFADIDEAAPSFGEAGGSAEDDRKRHDPARGAHGHGALRRRRPARGDEATGDHERQRQQDNEVRERARAYPAARELFDPVAGAERRHHVHAPPRQPVVEAARNTVGAGHDQREQRACAGHERGRRVHGHRGRTERHGMEGRQQQQCGQPGAGRRAEVRLAQVHDRRREHGSQRQHEDEHDQAGEKLAGHQRAVAERQGHRELETPVVVSRRPRAHCQCRDEHDRDPGKEQREEPHRRLVGRQELADREDRDVHAEHESECEHVAHRGVEREPDLVAHHRGGATNESGCRCGLRHGHVRPRDRRRRAGGTLGRAGRARRRDRRARRPRRRAPAR